MKTTQFEFQLNAHCAATDCASRKGALAQLRASLTRQIHSLIALPPSSSREIKMARNARAFALQYAWADMERAEALQINSQKGDSK